MRKSTAITGRWNMKSVPKLPQNAQTKKTKKRKNAIKTETFFKMTSVRILLPLKVCGKACGERSREVSQPGFCRLS